jgi:tetratricopeptide (TPR) repeat protein
VIVAGQSVFFVVSRYRLALVPILALFAGAWAAELVARRGRARVVAAGMGLVAGLAVVPWGLGPALTGWHATGLANEATRWERLGGAADAARAEALFRDALAADPSQTQAWQGLARVLARGGDTEAAERSLADGMLHAQPAHLLERDLIALLMKEGRADAAVPRLAHYLDEKPDDPDMLHAYALALAQTGRPDDAIAAARRLVTAAPGDPRGFNDLGILLARAGRADEAREVIARGLRLHPTDASLRHNLGVLATPADSARSSLTP